MFKKIFLKSYLLLAFMFLYLPLFFVIIFSFNNSGDVYSFKNFSFGFHFYKELFEKSIFLSSIIVSILIGILSALISTIMGTFAAISLSKFTAKKQKLFFSLNNIPIINADIITAAGLMILFISFMIPLGYFSLLASHISFCIPYVIVTITVGLKNINSNLINASLDLGATPFYTVRKIVIPLLKTAIIVSLILSFALSIDDFVISYFTSGPKQNASVYIYTLLKYFPYVNAFGVILGVFLAIIFAVFQFLSFYKNKKQRFIIKKKQISKKITLVSSKINKLEANFKNLAPPSIKKEHFNEKKT
ncbi:ABC transporter permease [symbiont of Argiope bruennichi]|uniref:ABC transporter permease n=1 Tax=symbiont of Argiope bruennichi TaxID=2810479 RepID=UPI003DA52FEB